LLLRYGPADKQMHGTCGNFPRSFAEYGNKGQAVTVKLFELVLKASLIMNVGVG